MTKLCTSVIVCIGFVVLGSVGHANKLRSVITIADKLQGKTILSKNDSYTTLWSEFDIVSKQENVQGTKEDLLRFIGDQVLEFSADEKSRIDSAVAEVDSMLGNLNITLPYPETITLIKSTCKEEGGAVAYTRSNNIVLSTTVLHNSYISFRKTFIHEIFHVLSRYSPKLRSELYKIIHATIGKPVELPKNLAKFIITNPDAPQTDCYLSLKHNDKPVDCIMVLYSKKEYSSGSFFEYLNIGFVALDSTNKETVALVNGSPVIYEMSELAGFYEQVGKNTNYIIHPEEIMADNFAFAVLNKANLPNPEIVQSIQTALRTEAWK